MTFKEFATLIAEQVEAAEKRGDGDEVIRVLGVLRSAIDDHIQKINDTRPDPTPAHKEP